MSYIQQQAKFYQRLSELDIWGWAGFLTPLFIFIQKFIYNDWNFLVWLLVLMFLDLFTGITKAVRNRTAVTSTGLRNTVIKVFQYGVFLIVIHVLIHFQIDGKEVGVLSYADEAGYTFLIVIEAKSIFENLQVLNPRVDFSGIIDKLKSVLPKKKE